MSKKKIEIEKSDDGEAIEIKGIEPGKEVEAIPDILEELTSMLGFLEDADEIVDKENGEGYNG
jgi:hypothetical protein